MNLKEYIQDARLKKYAICHFNVSNIEMFNAVANVVRKTDLPVIVGVSEGERKFIGLQNIVALVGVARKEGLPIFSNADHSYSFETLKEAVDAGFDSVIYDGASSPIEENIEITKKCVRYASDSGVLTEGELGYIGKSSRLLESIPDGIETTSLDDAVRYVEETGVDLFAPAVGNIHGMLRGASNPSLQIELIEKIANAVGVPLVLHGGSGIRDDDFRMAVGAGMSVVHISTELRSIYKDSLLKSLSTDVDELAPYKLMSPVMKMLEDKIEERMSFFRESLA